MQTKILKLRLHNCKIMNNNINSRTLVPSDEQNTESKEKASII